MAIALIASTPVSARSAQALWNPPGIMLGNGLNRGVVPDGIGGAFFMWDSTYNIPNSGYWVATLRAQHLNPGGVPLWGPRGVAFGAGAEYYTHRGFPDGVGGLIQSWEEDPVTGTLNPVYRVVHVNDAGMVLPAWRGTSHPRATNLEIVSDGRGGAFAPILAQQTVGLAPSDAYVAQLAASGDTAWIRHLPLISGTGQSTWYMSAATDDSLGVLVAWMGTLGRVDASGQLVWSTLLPKQHLAGWGFRIISDGQGGAYIAWQDNRTDTGDVYLLRIDGATHLPAEGWDPQGIPALSGSGAQSYVDMFLENDGGILIVGLEQSQSLRMTRMTASGASAPGWTSTGVTIAPQGMYEFDLAPAFDGGVHIAWQARPQSAVESAKSLPGRPLALAPLTTIYLQRFTGAGTVAASWPDSGMLVSSAAFPARDPTVISDDAEGVYLTWTVSEGGTYNTYGQHIVDTDQPTAIEISLISADAMSDHIQLVWISTMRGVSDVAIYRSARPGIWTSMGNVAVDGVGRISYQDRAVEPGASYGYRVGVSSSLGEEFSGETWVIVPRGPLLALEGARPNPSDTQLRVAFSLASASPALLELDDISGRRVLSRDVGAMGPGSHVVRFDDGQHVAPGLYFLRLTQSGRCVTARAVVVN